MAEGPDNTKVPPPKLGDLAKLRIDWYKVGKSLSFVLGELDQIKTSHKNRRNESHACQVAMFGKWLRDHPCPTAQNVIAALRSAGENEAAEELSIKYGEASEQHALVSLPKPKPAKISSSNLITSGPEKRGKRVLHKIASDIAEEGESVLNEKMVENRSLLQENKWLCFMALFDYDIHDIVTSPNARFMLSLNMGELPEVTEMAPILLRGPLFHFICFDLTQDMTRPVQAALNLDQDQKTSYTSWQTLKQFVHQVIETVTTVNWPWSSASSGRTPRERQTTAIVGVHSGKNQQVFRELPIADADIKSVVQSCGIDKAIRYCHRKDGQIIFPLDLRKSSDDTRVKEVVRQVLEKGDTCQIEMTGFILVHILAFRQGILNLSECRFLARLCGIPDSDLPGILKNVHDRLGLILYFQEVPKMKNLIICHPSELITPLELFIKVALSGNQSCPQDQAKVRKTGEIPLRLIDELMSHEEPDDKLTVSCLLELLKYYKFVSEAECVTGTFVYFMPCLLQPCPSSSQYTEKQTTASLLFCFKHGHSPHSSLFSALIAQLARNWKLATVDRYKDFITFIVDNSLLTEVELRDKGDHFQLLVLEPNLEAGLTQVVYARVRHEVQRALHLVKVRYTHLSSEVCHVGFYCPSSQRSSVSPHCALVRIVADDGVAYLQCPVQDCPKRGQRVRLDPIKEKWFTGEQLLNEKSVDGFANLMATFCLSSDIDEEDILQQMEAHIVEEGSIPLRVVRCGLYGAPGVGKTSSMKRLTNQIENLQGQPTLPSTGIEAPITVPLYTLPVLIAEQEWSCQNLDSQLQTILQCIIKTEDDPTPVDPSPTTGQNSSFSNPVQEASSFFSTSSQPNISALPSSLSSQVFEVPTEPIAYSTPETAAKPPRAPLPKHFNPRYIRNLIKKKSWKKMRNLLKEFQDVTLLNIVDTGGQPEYQDILPVLLGGSGLSLLFLNLSQELEKLYKVDYRHAAEGTTSIEYRSQFTTIDMLFQVLATLTSTCTTTRDHAAILVGTHQDQVTTKDINDLEEKLLKALQETEFLEKDIIKSFEVAGKKRNIFPLDNQTGSKGEIQQLQRIIRDIAGRFPRKILPTSWLLFHLALRYEHENKLGYCTMDQCMHLAARCGIQANDVPQILSYFHKNFGTILYFPDVPCMANIVICNPSVIFGLINSLVAESFNNHDAPHTAQNIRETGEISKDVLDRIYRTNTNDKKLHKEIFELLKTRNLVMEIHSETKGSRFFMPCLLYYCDEKTTSIEQLHAMSPAPLFIHFSCGYVPTGFFNVLIIGLQVARKWILADKTKRYKDRVSFITNRSSICQCTLTLHLKYIQVDVEAQETNDVCITIRQTLLSAIDETIKKHPYLESVKPNVQLLCQHATDQDLNQFAICHDPESPEKMRCLNSACSGNSNHILLPKHKIWFSSFKQTDYEEPMVIDDETPKAPPLSSASCPVYSPRVVRSQKMPRKLTNEMNLHTAVLQPIRTECTGDQTEMMEVCTASSTISAAGQLSKLHKLISIDDISELTRDLSPVFNDWFELGIELGFSPALLKPIEKAYPKMSRCMIEMLEAWIKRGINKTRSQIIEALRSPTLDHNAVAEELTRKYSLV